MKKQITFALAGLVAAGIAHVALPHSAQANGRTEGGTATPCTANYSDIDLASRSMSWGVYCPEGGTISVDAMVFYGSEPGVALPDQGTRYVQPGETWTIWSQDNTHTGFADHGVLHISQTVCNGPGCQLTLAHKVK
jgi:hypothetical protein